MGKVANPENLGKKINNSHVVFQVTKLVHEGVGDVQIARILNERYSFKVSVPSIAAFRNNYYERRLAEMKQFSNEFQQKQVGRIRTFIDESLNQAAEIKADIGRFQTQAAELEKKLAWVRRFEFIFETAVDQYVRAFDPGNPPAPFLEAQASPEEALLRQVTEAMGADGRSLLAAYIEARNSIGMVRSLSSLRTSTLGQRSALVKIHRDIFKGYRNFSIMQELVNVFEKYNALIVEEFFPDRDTMDRARYFRVRKRILALFDEFQIRYQGVDGPSDEAHGPAEEDLAEVLEKVNKTRIGPTPPSGEDKEPAPTVSQEAPAPTDELVVVTRTPLGDAEQAQMDNLFSAVIDHGADVVADLDQRTDRKHEAAAQEQAAVQGPQEQK